MTFVYVIPASGKKINSMNAVNFLKIPPLTRYICGQVGKPDRSVKKYGFEKKKKL